MTSQSDNEFHKLIIECLVSAAWQNLSPSAINIFRGLIKNIPSEIANSAKGGFVIVSVYLIFISNNLYKQAVILTEDCKQHRDKLEELQKKMEVVLEAMKTNFPNVKEHRLCHVVRANRRTTKNHG